MYFCVEIDCGLSEIDCGLSEIDCGLSNFIRLPIVGLSFVGLSEYVIFTFRTLDDFRCTSMNVFLRVGIERFLRERVALRLVVTKFLSSVL